MGWKVATRAGSAIVGIDATDALWVNAFDARLLLSADGRANRTALVHHWSPMQDSLEARLGAIDLEAVFRKLETDGVFCIEAAVSESELGQLREAVRGLLRDRGQRAFSLIQVWKTVPAFARMADTPAFFGLLRSLALRACNKQSVATSEVYSVLRVITGPKADRERPLLFHYDATVVTALVPIFIPAGEPSEVGDFVCFPNLRRVRKSVVSNFFEKALMQNPIARLLFARKVKQAKVVRLLPGNIYLFWGYRTYHANFSCSENALRATLLFHFGDPHLGSTITRSILAIRRWRVQRSIKAGLIDASNSPGR
jgi:hypothetical protein